MRKAFAFALIASAFGALWMGFAQTASAGEPDRGHEVCTSTDGAITTAQCARVEVSPEVNVPELGASEVLDDVTDSVDNLVDRLL